MAREMARVDLSGSAVNKVLDMVASGADPDDILRQFSTEGEDPELGTDPELGADFGGDFGEDISTVLSAMQGDGEFEPSDVGLDDDATGDDVMDGMKQLLAAASAGDEDAVGAIRRAARKIRNRGGQRAGRGGPARRRPNPPASPKVAARQIAAAAAAGMKVGMQGLTADLKKVLSRISPGEGPKTPLGINLPGGVADTVAAGATVRVAVRPPKDYILSHLLIGSEFASRFVINSISVQGDPVFATESFISAEQFRPDSLLNRLPDVWADGGKDIVISFTNVSGAASQLWGQFLGDEGTLEERQARANAGLNKR